MKHGIEKSMQSKFEQAFLPEELEITNESQRHAAHAHNPDPEHGETHFHVLIVSEKFVGKSRVERHRMVQSLLEEERERGLHALSLTLQTPAERSAG